MPGEGIEQRKLAAIMFTDMVGYSALAQQSEALALQLLEEHRGLLRSLFPRFNGREVKTIGDAFLVEFNSALEAAQCAIEIQRTLAKRNHDVAAARRIEVRIGIHIGDVVQRADGDVLGDGVNIASRIEPLAGANGICISVDVERQIRNTIEASLVKLGTTELKNIQVPMELFRIVLPWEKGPGQNLERGPHSAGQATVSRKQLRPAAKKLGWLAAFVVVFLLAWWLVHGPKEKQESETLSKAGVPGQAKPTSSLETGKKTIVVRGLVSLSPDSRDEYLGGGLTDGILNALMKVSAFRVIDSHDRELPVLQREFPGAVLLDGSVLRANNDLLITVKLKNLGDNSLVWSEEYSFLMARLTEARSDLTKKIASALKVKLLATEQQQLARQPTEDPEAYKLYLQGRLQWNRRNASNLTNAIAYFSQAIDKDQAYAIAYAGLAECYLLLPVYASAPQAVLLPKARDAARKALELDNSLTEPLATLAYIKGIFEWDWQSSVAQFQQAIEADPQSVAAHHRFGAVLASMGRWDEAVSEIKKAQEGDPLSSAIGAALGDALDLSGRAGPAIKLLKEQIALDPSFFLLHSVFGRVYLRNGKLSEAIAELETAAQLGKNGADPIGDLGVAYARAGRADDARKILERLQEFQRRGLDCRVQLALVQHALGDDEHALEVLESAVAEHAIGFWWFVRAPLWNDLRPNPRFQALLKKMNLPP